jgi:hypothetical protein
VQRLLEIGVPFGALELRLRDLYVEVAERELAISGRRETDSRVSLLTGINRKEVKRIRSAQRVDKAPRSFGMNQATILISRWTTDPRTIDKRGRPRPLPYRAARGPSFVDLARKVTGDLAPRVLLTELVRSGAAKVSEDNIITLRGNTYIPRVLDSEITILGEDPAELVDTILRNIFSNRDDRLLQRKIYFDNIGSDAQDRVRAQMRREGERFLSRINFMLSKYDRDRNPQAPGGDRRYASLGVYFFDSSPGEGTPEPLPPATRPKRGKRRK